ncbi:hypothetical protein HPP92_026941 [Vanilla planifolia]|uniref:DUF4220 domain-containing protein n=1 Tax=Vanilla planifolia TaxID=51239 RepID=A0A835PE65_VANPL|nr:hypothetical protein HPP92_026941 [Vanilla planifolia]
MAVWSNYLLANWVADFVLGQLSSSMDDNSNNAILAFRAPFLLHHLGGPDTITYSMEDNELWARRLLALAYELIIAVYVLFRSLPSNLLLAPTLLIFFVAIVKYAERSYSLYRASTDGFRSSVVISSKQSQLNQISSNRRTMVARVQDENEKEELNALKGAFDMYSVCKPFFMDVIPLVEVYKVIGDMLKEMTVKEVLGLTSMELSYAYDEMYMKAVVNCSRAGVILRG